MVPVAAAVAAEGPLPVREQFLLGAGFLAFAPEAVEVAKAGSWRWELVFDAANTWVRSEEVFDALEAQLETERERSPLGLEELRAIAPEEALFFADGELYRTTLTLRRGLGRGFEASLSLPWLSASGGFFDATIETYHDLVGYRDDQRPALPRDRYTVYLRSPEGRELFLDANPGPGLGDVEFGLKKEIPLPGRPWALAVEARVKAPTGEERSLYGTGAWDFGLRLLAGRDLGPVHLVSGLGATRLGSAAELGVPSQTRFAWFGSLELPLGSRTSLIGQVQLFESPLRDAGTPKLGDDVSTYEIGLRRRWNDSGSFFLALSENYRSFGNTADVGVHLGWSRVWATRDE